jgi:hypothetical protein
MSSLVGTSANVTGWPDLVPGHVSYPWSRSHLSAVTHKLHLLCFFSPPALQQKMIKLHKSDAKSPLSLMCHVSQP